MKIKVVECSEHNCIYGILTVVGVSVAEVQNKIYEIKNEFYENDIEDWTIEDVLEKFPHNWEWAFDTEVATVEI